MTHSYLHYQAIQLALSQRVFKDGPYICRLSVNITGGISHLLLVAHYLSERDISLVLKTIDNRS